MSEHSTNTGASAYGLPSQHPHPHDNGTGGVQPVLMGSPPVGMPMDARTLKSRIFSAKNKVFKSEMVTFFGEQLEIRQPTLSKMLSRTEDDLDDPHRRGVFVLLNYAYVPGTEIPVFDDADIEALVGMPYGEDFSRVMEAFQRVTGIDVKAAEKNSGTSLSASKS